MVFEVWVVGQTSCVDRNRTRGATCKVAALGTESSRGQDFITSTSSVWCQRGNKPRNWIDFGKISVGCPLPARNSDCSTSASTSTPPPSLPASTSEQPPHPPHRHHSTRRPPPAPAPAHCAAQRAPRPRPASALRTKGLGTTYKIQPTMGQCQTRTQSIAWLAPVTTCAIRAWPQKTSRLWRVKLHHVAALRCSHLLAAGQIVSGFFFPNTI